MFSAAPSLPGRFTEKTKWRHYLLNLNSQWKNEIVNYFRMHKGRSSVDILLKLLISVEKAFRSSLLCLCLICLFPSLVEQIIAKRGKTTCNLVFPVAQKALQVKLFWSLKFFTLSKTNSLQSVTAALSWHDLTRYEYRISPNRRTAMKADHGNLAVRLLEEIRYPFNPSNFI